MAAGKARLPFGAQSWTQRRPGLAWPPPWPLGPVDLQTCCSRLQAAPGQPLEDSGAHSQPSGKGTRWARGRSWTPGARGPCALPRLQLGPRCPYAPPSKRSPHCARQGAHEPRSPVPCTRQQHPFHSPYVAGLLDKGCGHSLSPSLPVKETDTQRWRGSRARRGQAVSRLRAPLSTGTAGSCCFCRSSPLTCLRSLLPQHPWAQEDQRLGPGQSDPCSPSTPAGWETVPPGSGRGRRSKAATGWVAGTREGPDTGQDQTGSWPSLSCGQKRPEGQPCPCGSWGGWHSSLFSASRALYKGWSRLHQRLKPRSASEARLSGHNECLSPENGHPDKRPRTETAPAVFVQGTPWGVGTPPAPRPSPQGGLLPDPKQWRGSGPARAPRWAAVWTLQPALSSASSDQHEDTGWCPVTHPHPRRCSQFSQACCSLSSVIWLSGGPSSGIRAIRGRAGP